MALHILLVGHGNMAVAMKAVCNTQGIECTQVKQIMGYDEASHTHHPTVAIHFGSGRQLKDLVDFCDEKDIPLIQGSTRGVENMPRDREVVIVNAPNLSLPMIRFLATFPTFVEEIRPGMKLGIMESHQSSKPDTSGTACALAEMLDVPDSNLMAIRTKKIQHALGVPEEHLDGHAYHFFTLNGQGVEIQVTTKINGRNTYAEGALIVAKTLVTNPLRAGVYQLKDILHLLPTD